MGKNMFLKITSPSWISEEVALCGGERRLCPNTGSLLDGWRRGHLKHMRIKKKEIYAADITSTHEDDTGMETRVLVVVV